MAKGLTYRDAGVDIDEGEALVERIKPHARRTLRPGVLAGITTLPVIGVPLTGTPLQGVDALLSIVQMPPGIPVATVAVGEMGARNAGHLAARILALGDPAIAESVERVRAAMRGRVRLPEGFI